jgi:hypothetical protein
MNKRDDGAPAFPETVYQTSFGISTEGGMRLRDYFAAQALAAALREFYGDVRDGGEVWTDHDDMAQHVYNIADAMMRAREAKP